MEMTTFKVWFATENYDPEVEMVRAFNQSEALILAQAERIMQGKDYTLHLIEVVGA